MTKILTTKNYSMFKFLKFNREVNERKVQAMVASYEAGLDLFHHFPIVVDKTMNIFDGQHRFEACKRLGIPIYYTQMERGSTVDSVSEINSNQTRWAGNDYMNAYCQKGVEDYIYLRDFFNSANGLSLQVCISIISQNLGGARSFRNGKFKMGSMRKAEQLGKYITQLRRIDQKKYAHRRIIESMVVFQRIPEFNFELFVEKCRTWDEKVKIMQNTKEQMWNLNEVYNFKSRINKVNIFRPELLSKIKDD